MQTCLSSKTCNPSYCPSTCTRSYCYF